MVLNSTPGSSGCGCEDLDITDGNFPSEQPIATLESIALSLESMISSITTGEVVAPEDENMFLAVSDLPTAGVESLTVSVESIADKAKRIVIAIFNAVMNFIKQVITYFFGFGDLNGGIFKRLRPEWVKMQEITGKYGWYDKMSGSMGGVSEAKIGKLHDLLMNGASGLFLFGAAKELTKIEATTDDVVQWVSQAKPRFVSLTKRLLADKGAEGLTDEPGSVSDSELADVTVPERLCERAIADVDAVFSAAGSISHKEHGRVENIQYAANQMRLLKLQSAQYEAENQKLVLKTVASYLKNSQPTIARTMQSSVTAEKVFTDYYHELERVTKTIGDAYDQQTTSTIRKMVSEFQSAISYVASYYAMAAKAAQGQIKAFNLIQGIADDTAEA